MATYLLVKHEVTEKHEQSPNCAIRVMITADQTNGR